MFMLASTQAQKRAQSDTSTKKYSYPLYCLPASECVCALLAWGETGEREITRQAKHRLHPKPWRFSSPWTLATSNPARGTRSHKHTTVLYKARKRGTSNNHGRAYIKVEIHAYLIHMLKQRAFTHFFSFYANAQCFLQYSSAPIVKSILIDVPWCSVVTLHYTCQST
jgi:hypothetical protein